MAENQTVPRELAADVLLDGIERLITNNYLPTAELDVRYGKMMYRLGRDEWLSVVAFLKRCVAAQACEWRELNEKLASLAADVSYCRTFIDGYAYAAELEREGEGG